MRALRILVIIAFATALRTTQAASFSSVSLADGGVAVNAGSFGEFTLSYPSLRRHGDKESKFIEKSVKGNRATLKYEGGSSIELSVAGDAVQLKFDKLPGDVEGIRMETYIDYNFSNGGKWKIDATEKEFPKEKPAKPFLYQGNAHALALTNFEGKTLTFTVPEHSWFQLQDNREWGWKIYCWWFSFPYNADHKTETLTFTSSLPKDGKRVIVVDELGQDAQTDWPEKVHSVDELKADVEAEKAWYASLTPLPPPADAFGGLQGSGAKLGLNKSGFFHVEKKSARWVLVDPDGNAFFHLGLCSFGSSEDYTYFKGRESIYAWIPPYESEFKGAFHREPYWSRDTFSYYAANVIRKYGKFDANELAARMIERVRKFGFNSGGAFSGIDKYVRESAHFPYVSFLPLGDLADVPGIRGTLDPFEPGNQTKIDANFAGLKNADDDPLLIGYFLSNEPNHEDLARAVASLPGKHACKQRLIALLKEKYKTSAAFNAAWGANFATFEQAAESGLSIKTKEAAEDMTAYTGVFFDAYYKLIAETFHKYDSHHLLIGNRWQPQTANSEQFCAIAGKYMDVISVNYYTYGLDKEYLNRVYTWSGRKPIFLSEFYWAAPKESGLPGGGKEVATQQERGLAYRNYVEQSAALGYVVGIEWFTLLDQARTGRFFERYNGENGNTGVFSVTDRPWKAMVPEMMKTNFEIYKVAQGERAPYLFENARFADSGGSKKVLIPRVPAGSTIKIDGRFEGWPGMPPELIPKQRVVEGSAGETEAAFRLCWDAKNLYIMVNVTDATPLKNSHAGADLWQGDGVELFIGGEKLDQAGGLQFNDRQILLSGAEKKACFFVNAAEQPSCEMIVVPAVDGKGYTLEAAIPWDTLKIKPEEGRELLFDLGVDDSESGNGRARQIMWNGTGKNSADRTKWGRAKLGQ
jgi:hypothetical protein